MPPEGGKTSTHYCVLYRIIMVVAVSARAMPLVNRLNRPFVNLCGVDRALSTQISVEKVVCFR